MPDYTCEYFETDRGDRPVEEFIDSLQEGTQRKFFYKKSLLEEFGPRLPFPHAKKLVHNIYELRFEGPNETARVLYCFFYGNRIVFTNGFKKKSQKTPEKEISLAVQRRTIFLKRKER